MTVCHSHMTGHLTYLCHLVRELHIVKYPEDNLEEIFPPVLLKRATIALHDLKHHSQPSAKKKKDIFINHLAISFHSFKGASLKINSSSGKKKKVNSHRIKRNLH